MPARSVPRANSNRTCSRLASPSKAEPAASRTEKELVGVPPMGDRPNMKRSKIDSISGRRRITHWRASRTGEPSAFTSKGGKT